MRNEERKKKRKKKIPHVLYMFDTSYRLLEESCVFLPSGKFLLADRFFLMIKCLKENKRH